MALKTFSDGVALPASDINSFLTNSGLVYVNTFTATSGNTLNCDNAFTTTYTNYRVLIHSMTTSGAVGLAMGLRAAGTTLGTSGYYSGRQAWDYSTGAIQQLNTANAAIWNIPVIGSGVATASSSCSLDIYTPKVGTFYTSFSGTGTDSRAAGGSGSLTGSGFYNAATSVDGIVISSGGQTFTNLTVVVYGYRNI